MAYVAEATTTGTAIARAIRPPVRSARGMRRRYQRGCCRSVSTWLGNGRCVGGKPDLDHGASFGGGAQRGLAAPPSGHLGNDREPEAGPGSAAPAGRPAVEALEDPAALFGGNAASAVGDADHGGAAAVL